MVTQKTFTAAADAAEDWKVFDRGDVDLEITTSATFTGTLSVDRRCKNTDGTYGPIVSFGYTTAGVFSLPTCHQMQPEYRMYIKTGNYTNGPVTGRLAQS